MEVWEVCGWKYRTTSETDCESKMRQCNPRVKKPTGTHSLPEELGDGFCLFGDALVWPAGEPEVPEAAFLSRVQVAQT